MLSHVTFTGWDRHTDLGELVDFLTSNKPRSIEVAVLMSSTRVGADRYPDADEAALILRAARSAGHRTAAHLCGRLANNMLKTPETAVPLFEGLLGLADRIQVNVPETFWPPVDRYFAAGALGMALRKPIIVQVRGQNWPDPWHGVQYLFDRSGGRGEVADQVPPLTAFMVGYAGGLGPENVHAFLDRLRPMRQPRPLSDVRFTSPIWIDMESGIRESMSAFPGGPQPTPDTRSEPATQPPTRVSVAKCQQVMDAVRWALMPG